MGELINIPASEDNQIKAILDVLATNGGDDVGQIFEALLGQDDDRFEVLAKPITESYLQSLSDSNAKLLIAQSMNALVQSQKTSKKCLICFVKIWILQIPYLKLKRTS